jgi:hypothetical protein
LAGQRVHCVAPVDSAYQPGAHLQQLDAPVREVKEPAAQGVHEDAPAEE